MPKKKLKLSVNGARVSLPRENTRESWDELKKLVESYLRKRGE